ncbi:carbohydrate kinase family protein [Bacillus sp. IITD106]|nr:carbohydrate kinase family protein [Bacillus sp. IITD106]
MYVVAIGGSAIDEYYICKNWPELGDKAIVQYLDSKVGGMIANAASILANYSLKTYILDNLGDDQYTTLILEDLKSNNINTDYIEIVPETTNNKTFIMLSKEEKTIFVARSPNKPPLTIDPSKRKLLLNAKFVYSSIPEMKKIPDHHELIIEMVNNGVQLILDVEKESFVNREKDQFYFKHASTLFFNEFAFEKYCTGINKNSALGELLLMEGKTIVITLGAKGCYVATKSDSFQVNGHKVNVVDTTGAGDAFNSTFVYGLSQNWPLKKCATIASAAAAKSVQHLGPKAGVSSIDSVINFMKNKNNDKDGRK